MNASPRAPRSFAQRSELRSGDPPGGLDLEGDSGPVVTFDDEVDFVAVMGAPSDPPRPARPSTTL